MALPAANLFSAVVTSRFSAHPSSLCGLRVDYPSTRLGVSSEAGSQALVDCLVHPFPGAVEAPSSEVVVDSLPGRSKSQGKAAIGSRSSRRRKWRLGSRGSYGFLGVLAFSGWGGGA